MDADRLGVLAPIAVAWLPMRSAATTVGARRRRWTLIAEAGMGPRSRQRLLQLALRLLDGKPVAAGARPCIGTLRLDEIEAGLSSFRIRFGRSERPAPPLLECV